jgi:hypothetical protein
MGKLTIATAYRVHNGVGWVHENYTPFWPAKCERTPSTSYTVWNFAWGDPCDD